MRVQDLMTEQVVTVRGDDTLDLVSDLMDQHCVRHLPVVDDEENLVGLITHRDLLRGTRLASPDAPAAVEREILERRRVEEVMTIDPVAVDGDTLLSEAAAILLENKYGALPVVSGTRLVGIVTESDFVRLAAETAG